MTDEGNSKLPQRGRVKSCGDGGDFESCGCTVRSLCGKLMTWNSNGVGDEVEVEFDGPFRDAVRRNEVAEETLWEWKKLGLDWAGRRMGTGIH